MLQGIIPQTFPLPAKPTIDKEQKIIVRLNDQNQKPLLREVITDTVTNGFHVRIESLGYRITVLTSKNDATE